jgi:hypothetical protein
MYAASFGHNGWLWLSLLVIAELLAFYISIISRERHFLGIGAFFLMLTIVTIAFKYFSDFGVSVCLIISAAGLLGTAVAAASINRRYFKKAS